MIDQLKNLLSKGVEAGLIRKDINLEAASIGLFGMIQGLVNMWAKNEGKHPLDDFSPHIEAIVLHVLGICN